MLQPKITVVVPIYNVSKYLRQCLDSIVNQTLKEIEIILVNDDSPDPEDDTICKFYERNYQNVIYIKHGKNKGLGGARNTGIEKANAKYITFIDSDDWLELTMLEELYAATEEKKASIGQCYFYDHYQDIGKKKLRRVKQFRKYPDRMNAINVLAWNKIYKTDLYKENKIYFPEKIASQDVATMPRLLYYVDKVALVKKPLYNYRANRLGAITSDFKKLLTDLPIVFGVIKNFLVEIDRFEKDRRFFEKRVLKSLIHHLERFKKDSRMQTSEKDMLIYEHIYKSLAFLRTNKSKEIKSLDLALKFLKKYRFKLRLGFLKTL